MRVLQMVTLGLIIVDLVGLYLTVNKIWSRKHERSVAEAQSVMALALAMGTALPWLVKYLVARDWESSLASSLELFELSIFFLIGMGLWVPDAQRRGFWAKVKAAFNLERQEAGDLVKRWVRPDGAKLIIDILHNMAMIDRNLDAKERAFINEFAKSWNIQYDADALLKNGAGRGGDYIALRSLVSKYLAIHPPVEQVAQLHGVLDALSKIDGKVGEEETLILGEIFGMLDSYCGDGEVSSVSVLIVPQNRDQEDAARNLLNYSEYMDCKGGKAFFVGSYYSEAYAEVVCTKYRSMHFFTIIDAVKESEEMETDDAIV